VTPSADVLAAALAAATRRDADGDAATTVATANAAAVVNGSAELARERSIADINMSVGWIPGVGTLVNGISLVSNFLDFTIAALSGDVADMRDEIGDMTLDVIGMIPVVGAPLAATIYRAVTPVGPPPNRAPSAVPDSFTTNQDTQLTGNVLTNDTDPDGDVLTAVVDTGPGHGSLVLDANGSFTYAPAENYYGTDTFSYTVSDGKGSNALGTATITVNYVAPPPVIDQQHPYSIDDTDPETGKISGHFNVTHEKPVTYRLDTTPDPALGTFELNEQTGEWTFTPNPRTRVLAGYFAPDSPAAVTLKFAVIATDGIAATAPIAVFENIAGTDRAVLALPAGTTPVLSLVDPTNGEAYVFGYSGDPLRPPGEQSSSHVAIVIHSDGSYSVPTGNSATGLAYQFFVEGDTAYVFTVVGDQDPGYTTYLSALGPNGLTPVGGPMPGLALTSGSSDQEYHPIVIGDTTYFLTERSTSDTGYETHITALGPDGVMSYTDPVPGYPSRDPIVIGDTTYLLFDDHDTGAKTRIIALGPDGVTPKTVIAGSIQRNPIVIGDTTYLLTQSGLYDTGYETHVTALGPDGITPTMTIAGSIQRDPIVIGDTTYLLITPYSRIVTHVLALTPTGPVPVGSIAGVMDGDPIVVDGTTYLLSETGDDDPATWHTWVTTLTPTPGGITVGDPIPGQLADRHQIVVGDTTYLLTQTWNSSVGYETHLTALRPDGLTPLGIGVLGRVAFEPVLVVGDTTYLMTTARYYWPADWTYAYSRTFLTVVGPGGLTTEPDPLAGYPSGDRIVIGDTTYLVMEEESSSAGYQTQLVVVTTDGFTTVGDPIPGRVNSTDDFQVIAVGDTTYLLTTTGDQTHLTALGPSGMTPTTVAIPGTPQQSIIVGGTTYLVTTTGDEDAGYQTHLTVLGSNWVAQLEVVIPGRTDSINGETFPPLIVGGTTYLVTLTGEYDTVESFFTALSPTAVTGPAEAIPGEVGWFPGEPMTRSVFVVGDTTYVATVEYVKIGENSYSADRAHLVALTPTDVIEVGALRSISLSPITIGGITHFVTRTGDDESGYQTHLIALTPVPTPAADPFPGYPLYPSVITVGDTAYLLTTSGLWAIDVDV
jgi:VCBS repeat-containing protein